MENVLLKGLKLKIFFRKRITSMKLVTEFEEKMTRRLNYAQKDINYSDCLLYFKKKEGDLKYKIFLHEDHLSFYVENIDEDNIAEYFRRMVECTNLVKEVLYSYQGENPGIKGVIFTKGYYTQDVTEYIKSSDSSLLREGVKVSVKYTERENINLLIITSLKEREELRVFFNNISKNIEMLYKTNL